MKTRDFDKLVTKFRMRSRHGRDLWAWFEHDGKIITRTRRSKGTGELPENVIRQQLKLSKEQFRLAMACTINREDYIRILKKKGLIQPSGLEE